MKAQHPHHWTAREFPLFLLLMINEHVFRICHYLTQFVAWLLKSELLACLLQGEHHSTSLCLVMRLIISLFPLQEDLRTSETPSSLKGSLWRESWSPEILLLLPLLGLDLA